MELVWTVPVVLIANANKDGEETIAHCPIVQVNPTVLITENAMPQSLNRSVFVILVGLVSLVNLQIVQDIQIVQIEVLATRWYLLLFVNVIQDGEEKTVQWHSIVFQTLIVTMEYAHLLVSAIAHKVGLEPRVKLLRVWDTILPKERPVVDREVLVSTIPQLTTIPQMSTISLRSTTLLVLVLAMKDGQAPLATHLSALPIVLGTVNACPLLPLHVPATKDGLEPIVLLQL